RPLAVHLRVGDVGVPVGDVAPPSSPRVLVDAGLAEGSGYQRGSALPVGPCRLPIDVEFGVVAAGSPALQNLLRGLDGAAGQGGERVEVRSRGGHLTAVEIAVGPAIETMPDAGSEGVVHRRVAESAVDPDGGELPASEESADADDC